MFFVFNRTGLPSSLDVLPGTSQAVWATVAHGISSIASENSIGPGTYYTSQSPDNLFDGSLKTKYASRGNSTTGNNAIAGINTGFIVTMAQCSPVLLGFIFGNAFNNSDREPLTTTIEGSNCPNTTICTAWTLIYNGSTGLDTQEDMLTYGQYQSLTNTASYQSYRFLMTSKRGSISSFVTYTEVLFYGYSNQNSTTNNGSSVALSAFTIQTGSIQGLWNTYANGISTLATANGSGVGTYPSAQAPDNILDGNFNTRYSSRGFSRSGNNSYSGLNTGFYLTVAGCQPSLRQFSFATAYIASPNTRDPITTTVEGTNCYILVNCTSWTLLYNGPTGLANVTTPSTFGPNQTVSNNQSFTSYRFLITAKRGPLSDFVTYSEVALYGY